MKFASLASVIVAGCILAGCKATHLAYVYDIDIGIDVAYSQQGSGKLVVGYDRGTYAIVPQRDDDSRNAECLDPASVSPEGPDAEVSGELMSIAAISKVEIQGVDSFEFYHFISTGEAARKMTKQKGSQRLDIIREAIFGEPTGGGQ